MSMNIKFTGDWARAKATLGAAKSELKGKIAQAIMQEAHFFAGKVKEQLSQAANFAPLSEFTLKLRKLKGFGGDKPLNASGDLKGAVGVTPNTPSMRHFVGVLRSARTADGKSLANIGDVHEHGATIVMRMTPAMRRFLFGVLFKDEPKQYGPTAAHQGSGIIVIKIPARPFIAPVFERYGPGSGERVQKRLLLLLGGKLGTP